MRLLTTLKYLALAAAACVLPVSVHAQAKYPERPITIIVPFAAGNSSDIVTRMIGERLSRRLGQPIIVDNRPGAGGTIGTAHGVKQPADGYTLIFGSPGPLVIAPAVLNSVPYTLDDLDAVAPLVGVPMAFVVPANSPIKDIPSLIEATRSRGTPLFYGSSGTGGTQHLLVAGFDAAAGITMTHAPYKGGVAALTDLAAGRIDLTADSISVLQPQLDAGRVRAIAVTSAQRIPQLPDTPTIKEQGVDFSMQSWMTLMAPHGTPPAILDRLSKEVREILALPDVEKQLAGLGFTPMNMDRSELMAFVKNEQRVWGKVVDLAGAKQK